MSTLTLRPVDGAILERLLDLAVAQTDPDETMPAVPGPPGWTEARRAEFRDRHRRSAQAILLDEEVIGAVRFVPAEAPGAVQAAIWLARSVRGKGYGTEAGRLSIDEARANGVTALIAETTTSNAPSIGILRSLGAKLWEDPDTGAVHATLRVGETGH
jgi:RimJ/RimL family protein N-acetyltransferase